MKYDENLMNFSWKFIKNSWTFMKILDVKMTLVIFMKFRRMNFLWNFKEFHEILWTFLCVILTWGIFMNFHQRTPKPIIILSGYLSNNHIVLITIVLINLFMLPYLTQSARLITVRLRHDVRDFSVRSVIFWQSIM